MIIGIDGGGTKTIGILVDEQGSIASIATVGPTNPNSSNYETIRAELKKLFFLLKKEKALTEEDIVFAGISGVESGGKKEWFTKILREFTGITPQIIVDNDAITALYSETKGEAGIVCISGTGSIAFGVNDEQKRERVGGWGYLIKDEYSGFSIGKQALDKVFFEFDKGMPASVLAKRILDLFNVEQIPQLVPQVYELGKTRDRVASIAELVITLSNNGDETCRKLLHIAAASMLEDIKVLYGKLYDIANQQHSPLPIILTGGVNQHAEALKGFLEKEAEKQSLPFSFKRAAFPPIAGTVYAAQKKRGKKAEAAFVNRLEQELTSKMKLQVKG
jgi:N-acetylglucosamine kinase-like BadF-type ATPase